METVQIQSLAFVHYAQKSILIDDVSLKRGDALAGIGAVEQKLFDHAVIVDDIAVVAAGKLTGGADGRDLRAGLRMLVHGGGEVDVCAYAAEQERDMLLRNVTHIGGDGVERLDGAGVVAAVIFRQAERRQHTQPAVAAAHVPVLAAADMVEQGLVVALHDDADVAYTGVHHGGEGKVDKTVASAERKGRRGAAADKLA